MITIQWDALLAEQFDMYYIDENGDKQRPYIIHRTSMLLEFFEMLDQKIGFQ